MRIQDLESSSGLERATIRYYEKEGLIHPARTDNGYRDYSESDLEELKRIRLFRQLEMPLEQIRQLQQGTGTLTAALSSQLRMLGKQEQAHRTATEICSKIQTGERCYAEINADTYLQMFHIPQPPKPTNPPQKPQTYREILGLNHHPGRRFFARLTDLLLLHGLLLLMVIVGMRVRTNLKYTNQFYLYNGRRKDNSGSFGCGDSGFYKDGAICRLPNNSYDRTICGNVM